MTIIEPVWESFVVSDVRQQLSGTALIIVEVVDLELKLVVGACGHIPGGNRRDLGVQEGQV
jgi:hypothetical protein